MTIQDLVDWCKNKKNPYPLTARLIFEDRNGKGYELDIDGCDGHGHDKPETLILCEKGMVS